MLVANPKEDRHDNLWPPSSVKPLIWACNVIWGFTKDDFVTFVVPCMSFGILGALSSMELIHGGRTSSSIIEFLGRLQAVLIYNWSNLIVFDLANQRSPESVTEDKINKPWRPIPTGKITIQQTRRALLIAVPVVTLLNYVMGVWEYGLVIHLIVWLYNDLGGGDEVIVRDFLIGVGYAMFNAGSLQIASGADRLNQRGLVWTALISTVIFTTMQIQDLKDEKGDRARGRKTILVVFGHFVSRTSIALFVVVWSALCISFWWPHFLAAIAVVLLAATILFKVTCQRGYKADAASWKLWCWWLVVLYSLPLFSHGTGHVYA